MNQHDAGAISAAKCRELLGLQELSFNHLQPWFPSPEELAQAVEELSSIVSPRGLSADDIEVIAQLAEYLDLTGGSGQVVEHACWPQLWILHRSRMWQRCGYAHGSTTHSFRCVGHRDREVLVRYRY